MKTGFQRGNLCNILILVDRVGQKGVYQKGVYQKRVYRKGVYQKGFHQKGVYQKYSKIIQHFQQKVHKNPDLNFVQQYKQKIQLFFKPFHTHFLTAHQCPEQFVLQHFTQVCIFHHPFFRE